MCSYNSSQRAMFIWGISSVVERPLSMREVTGSIPVFSTFFFLPPFFFSQAATSLLQYPPPRAQRRAFFYFHFPATVQYYTAESLSNLWNNRHWFYKYNYWEAMGILLVIIPTHTMLIHTHTLTLFACRRTSFFSNSKQNKTRPNQCPCCAINNPHWFCEYMLGGPRAIRRIFYIFTDIGYIFFQED